LLFGGRRGRGGLGRDRGGRERVGQRREVVVVGEALAVLLDLLRVPGAVDDDGDLAAGVVAPHPVVLHERRERATVGRALRRVVGVDHADTVDDLAGLGIDLEQGPELEVGEVDEGAVGQRGAEVVPLHLGQVEPLLVAARDVDPDQAGVADVHHPEARSGHLLGELELAVTRDVDGEHGPHPGGRIHHGDGGLAVVDGQQLVGDEAHAQLVAGIGDPHRRLGLAVGDERDLAGLADRGRQPAALVDHGVGDWVPHLDGPAHRVEVRGGRVDLLDASGALGDEEALAAADEEGGVVVGVGFDAAAELELGVVELGDLAGVAVEDEDAVGALDDLEVGALGVFEAHLEVGLAGGAVDAHDAAAVVAGQPGVAFEELGGAVVVPDPEERGERDDGEHDRAADGHEPGGRPPPRRGRLGGVGARRHRLASRTSAQLRSIPTVCRIVPLTRPRLIGSPLTRLPGWCERCAHGTALTRTPAI
jgi:hypothetical protein